MHHMHTEVYVYHYPLCSPHTSDMDLLGLMGDSFCDSMYRQNTFLQCTNTIRPAV